MTKIIPVLILLIATLSCNSNCDCTEGFKDTQIHHNQEDTTFNDFNQKIALSSYEYSDSIRLRINKWKDSLPQNIKDSLLEKKYLIQTTYFLQKIILENNNKIKAIQKYNQLLESHLSLKVGHIQGIPTIMFTTSLENIHPPKTEHFTLKLNKLTY
jgi:hypothetical protein